MNKNRLSAMVQKYLPYPLAFLSSVAMFLKLDSREKDTLTTYFSDENINAASRLMDDFRASLVGNYGLNGLVVLVLLSVLYKKVLPISNKRLKLWTIPFAALFGLSMVFGYSFQKTDSWDYVFGSLRNVAKAGVAATGYAILFYISICGLYLLLEKWANRPRARLKPRSSKILGADKAHFIRIWAVIFVCWIPYFIIFFPALINDDNTSQIANVLGYYDKFYYYTTAFMRDTATISDHHPVFHTLLVGGAAKLGLKLGHMYIGLFLYTMVQSLMMSAGLAASVCLLAKMEIPKKYLKIMVCFYALFPLFPIHSMTMVKNSLYTVVLLIYMIMLVDFMLHHEQRSKDKKWLVGFCCMILLQMLVVKYGMYVFLISAVPFLIVYRKHWKRLVPVCLVPLLFFQVIYTGMILPAFHITMGDPKESYSIQFQQTARYVIKHGDEVTAEEREVLDKVFYYDEIEANYTPTKVDSIKFKAYRTDTVTQEDLDAYFQVWLKQMMKHPETYIEAFLNSIYGYLYVNDTSWIGYWEIRPNLEEKTDGDYVLESPEGLTPLREWAKLAVHTLSFLPGIGLLFRGSIHIWITLISMMFVIVRKKWKWLLPMLPLAANILVCLTGPENANPRYCMPVLVCSAFVVGLLLYAMRETSEAPSDSGPGPEGTVESLSE